MSTVLSFLSGLYGHYRQFLAHLLLKLNVAGGAADIESARRL